MKKIYCLLMVAGLVTACAKDDGAGDMPQGKGVVAFDATHQLTVETRADNKIELGSLGITLPESADDLTLVIESQDPAHTEPFQYSGTVGAYNKDSRRTYLAEGGPYAAEVMWGNATTEGVDAAYFHGQTGFNVIARSYQAVSAMKSMGYTNVKSIGGISKYKGNAYLGIDSGSTTIKCCLLSSDCKVLLTDYRENNGNPVSKVKDFLENIYEKYPGISIKASCSTGYGETLMKKAFNLDYSLVETEAHYKGAKHFKKNVDFILDIGGQDIKCFKIKDGAIDDIF